MTTKEFKKAAKENNFNIYKIIPVLHKVKKGIAIIYSIQLNETTVTKESTRVVYNTTLEDIFNMYFSN